MAEVFNIVMAKASVQVPLTILTIVAIRFIAMSVHLVDVALRIQVVVIPMPQTL